MRDEKSPALLAVVILTEPKQWFVAGLTDHDAVLPLVCSEEGNLDDYVGLHGDEQLSFLRHRIAGAIQRGFDRLFARQAKAQRIILIVDNDFPDADATLLDRLAEHFHTWMARPPVSCYRGQGFSGATDFDTLDCVIGRPNEADEAQLRTSMAVLVQMTGEPEHWERIPTPAA